MHHALSLSIIRGRGDVVTRFMLLLSADAYAMQLCKQGPGPWRSAVAANEEELRASREDVRPRYGKGKGVGEPIGRIEGEADSKCILDLPRRNAGREHRAQIIRP